MTPVIEVSHLPSSASFYAAVCQPLGIHFVHQPSHSSSLDFGLPASPAGPCEILFTLTASCQPQISFLKFRASSQAAVTDFHWRALQANYNSIVSTNLIKNTPDESIARITDLDGNMLEARFIRRNSVLTTASPKENRRVLDWQRDVAKSISSEETTSAPPLARHSTPLIRSSSSRGYEAEQEPRLVRRETVATSHPTSKEVDVSSDSRIINGLSNQALIGTILGAAAGAALAYTMVKSEEPRPNEVTRPRMVTYHSTPAAASPRVEEVETIVEAMSIRSESHAGSKSKTVDPPVIKQEAVNGKPVLEEIDEERSVTHVSRRSHGSHESHRSQRKESPPDRESESRKGTSEVSKSSRHTSKSKKAKDQPEVPDPPESASGRSQKSDIHDDSKSRGSKSESRHTSSYVSARSEASTVKPKDKEKTRSKVTTTLTVSNKEALDRASQKGSVISARNIPLPESTHVTRSSHREHRDRDRDSGISGISARDVPLPESTFTIMSARNYPLPESVYDGPAYSVAPSDSISSVGLKKERQRRRM